MANLEKTREALAHMEANVFYSHGEHMEREVRTGASGVEIGASQFDATRHDPADIDHLSPMESVLRQPHVSEVLPNRPFHFSIIGDTTLRAEHPSVRSAKLGVVGQMIYDLDDALPGATDQSYLSIVGQDIKDLRVDEHVDAKERGELKREILDVPVYSHGLVIAVSDFQRMQFGPGSLEGVLAVKLNHPLEREIPANVGRISLGGAHELDTRNPQQLTAYNGLLQRRHETTVSGLEAAGAAVTSVVFDPGYELGYDITTADEEIAGAVNRVGSQTQA